MRRSRRVAKTSEFPGAERMIADCPESLKATGYFDEKAVEWARQLQLSKSVKSLQRFSLDMGLMGVLSRQLWQHIYGVGGLCELPAWTPPDLTQTRLYGRLEASVPAPVAVCVLSPEF
jgi:hypothetical protein